MMEPSGTSTANRSENNESSPLLSDQPTSTEPGPNVVPGRRFRDMITVEPMIFLYMTAFSSIAVNVQNLYVETICEREYAHETEIKCANLSLNSTEEANVERIATYYATYRALIEAAIPVVFSLFIGPWSDKHGSKPIMLLSLVGYIISSALFYVFSGIQNQDPAILLVASIPVALSGGIISFMLAAFRYVSCVSSEENRSFRMAMAQASLTIGTACGLLGSVALSKSVDVKFVFLASFAFFSASFIYTVFCIKNDKPADANSSTAVKDLFNLEAVKESFSAAFKSRPGSKRLWLWLLLGTVYLYVFVVYGNATVAFLYTYKVFHWDVGTYSAYSTFDNLIQFAGVSIAAVVTMKVFQLSDVLVAILSAIGGLGGTLVWALSPIVPYGWMMYLGSSIQMFFGLSAVVARSMITKMVDEDEIGKVFSLLASGEAAVPILTAPIYNAIYAQTLESYPATAYALNFLLIIVILLAFGYFGASSWNSVTSTRSGLQDDEIED